MYDRSMTRVRIMGLGRRSGAFFRHDRVTPGIMLSPFLFALMMNALRHIQG